MANGGWYGTQEEWDKLEEPLLEVDSIINEFADEYNLGVNKNHKDWPGRHFIWGNKARCLIQLFLKDEEQITYTLWLCASQDRDTGRYWKQKKLVDNKKISQFKHQLKDLLVEGKEWLDCMDKKPSQLEKIKR